MKFRFWFLPWHKNLDFSRWVSLIFFWTMIWYEYVVVDDLEKKYKSQKYQYQLISIVTYINCSPLSKSSPRCQGRRKVVQSTCRDVTVTTPYKSQRISKVWCFKHRRSEKCKKKNCQKKAHHPLVFFKKQLHHHWQWKWTSSCLSWCEAPVEHNRCNGNRSRSIAFTVWKPLTCRSERLVGSHWM